MDRIHAVIHGRVQGVGFRANTQEKAKRLNMTGWVRNNPDGSVEVVAEGNHSAVESLVDFLKEGPASANVTSADIDWYDSTGEFNNFIIKH